MTDAGHPARAIIFLIGWFQQFQEALRALINNNYVDSKLPVLRQ
jgi:hypothetical protein